MLMLMTVMLSTSGEKMSLLMKKHGSNIEAVFEEEPRTSEPKPDNPGTLKSIRTLICNSEVDSQNRIVGYVLAKMEEAMRVSRFRSFGFRFLS